MEVLGIMESYDEVIEKRIAYDNDYQAYIQHRNSIETETSKNFSTYWSKSLSH